MQNSNTKPTIWYKQFWPWFLLAPLITSVIVGTTMLTFSIKEFDGTVNDNYYKEGKAINQVLERDRNAAALGMAASLSVDNLTGDVLVQLNGDLKELPEQLLLKFVNPTRADKDYSAILNRVRDNQFRGSVEKAPLNFWYLDISSPKDSSWRIKGGAEFPIEQPLALKAGE